MTSAGNSPDGHPTAKSVNVAPFTLAKGGVSMGDKTLSFAENVFGRRFDDVRIHNDDEGHAIASGKGARAVTVGKHIYFAKGQYSPENAPGKALLAHELTHIAQTGGGTVTKPEVARPGGSLAGARDAEAQAEEVERAVFSGRPAPAIGQLTPGPVELRKVIGGHSESEVTKFARQHGESMDLYAPGTKSVDKSVRTQVAPDGPPAEILAR